MLRNSSPWESGHLSPFGLVSASNIYSLNKKESSQFMKILEHLLACSCQNIPWQTAECACGSHVGTSMALFFLVLSKSAIFALAGGGKRDTVSFGTTLLCENLRELFCGFCILTSVLLGLEQFEVKALPKAEMNCKTNSKLLSSVIHADTSVLPAGDGTLT